MMTAQIGALFARRDQAWADRDVAALVAPYAENCVLESPTAGTILGREAIERVYRIWFTAFPDIAVETEELLIVGDRVIQTLLVRGTDTGGFLGFPPTGKPIRVRGVFLFTLEGNQFVRERRILDFSSVLLQLAGETAALNESSSLYRQTIERARLEHDIRMAAEIQRALLPERRYTCAHFEIEAASVPCRAIGGDFFDYYSLSAGTFGFLIGDVSGKGPPAALMAAALQGMFSAHAQGVPAPAQTMTLVNDTLVRRAVEARFATLWFAVLSSDGELTYCNAGHNSPILIRKRGVRRLETGGTIVGVFKQASFEQEVLQMEPGDTLVVFSDGVTEALNCDYQEFGEERLFACLQAQYELPAASLVASLLHELRLFSVGAEQSDDLTVLVLRYFGREFSRVSVGTTA